MDLLERAVYLAIGGGIGFILGYIVRALHTIEEEVHDVKDIAVHQQKRDERGAVSMSTVGAVALALVVLMTAAAAWNSGVSASRSQDALDQQKRTSTCTRSILSDLVVAVNERTTYAGEQLRTNIDLQRAQSEFLGTILADPPASETARAAALRNYFNELTDFVQVNGKAASKAEENPYPKIAEYEACLMGPEEGSTK